MRTKIFRDTKNSQVTVKARLPDTSTRIKVTTFHEDGTTDAVQYINVGNNGLPDLIKALQARQAELQPTKPSTDN